MPFMEADKLAGAKPQGRIIMATVKGDVHDIGKNIVGVVLQCNNYEVIDLGVMVPAPKILETAREQNADAVGLSGLITPSLDEMVHVAQEMERERFELPLLIGGATTSRAHTAVKIAPQYHGSTVHVLDASRAVGVVNSLLNGELRADFVSKMRDDYARLREQHAAKTREKQLLTLNAARANRLPTDWTSYEPPMPEFTGPRVVYPSIVDLREFIDWSPFFHVWELRGRYPTIFDDPVVGKQAHELFDDAQEILDRVIADDSLHARGVFGFWRANANGDDVDLFAGESQHERFATFYFLRQQMQKPAGQCNHCLADFVAPKSGTGFQPVEPDDTEKMSVPPQDYIGGFAVAIHCADELAKSFAAAHDDYSAIMAKALADRLAEAFAEYLHKQARIAWGFGRDENLSNEDLIRERYRGIRPAPGYPACPDHVEKRTLFDLLGAEQKIDIRLTESFAMHPAASVSGFYFSHPDAKYFGVGQIGRDQVMDYAQRRGEQVNAVEKRLAAHLGYDPDS
jgi:5-methyltetrahydrofolate--homocysteine methyltransferase